MTKTELMKLVLSGVTREAFTFYPDDGSKPLVFDVTAARELVEAHKLPTFTVGVAQMAPYLRESREFDQSRVDSLPEESWKNDPPIFVAIPETPDTESHLLIDGLHRVLRNQQEGVSEMSVYMIPYDLAPVPPPGFVSLEQFGIGYGDTKSDGTPLKP